MDKYMEENGRGLIDDIIQVFVWRAWNNYEESKSK
jgi:hypothetical protein